MSGGSTVGGVGCGGDVDSSGCGRSGASAGSAGGCARGDVGSVVGVSVGVSVGAGVGGSVGSGVGGGTGVGAVGIVAVVFCLDRGSVDVPISFRIGSSSGIDVAAARALLTISSSVAPLVLFIQVSLLTCLIACWRRLCSCCSGLCTRFLVDVVRLRCDATAGVQVNGLGLFVVLSCVMRRVKCKSIVSPSCSAMKLYGCMLCGCQCAHIVARVGSSVPVCSDCCVLVSGCSTRTLLLI